MQDIIPDGTVCRIRAWDDMSAEYRAGHFGNFIEVDNIYFLDSMKYLCGQTFTVKWHEVEDEDTGTMRYYSEEGIEKRECASTWIITAGMLELVCCAEEDDTDLVAPDLSDLFST